MRLPLRIYILYCMTTSLSLSSPNAVKILSTSLDHLLNVSFLWIRDDFSPHCYSTQLYSTPLQKSRTKQKTPNNQICKRTKKVGEKKIMFWAFLCVKNEIVYIPFNAFNFLLYISAKVSVLLNRKKIFSARLASLNYCWMV